MSDDATSAKAASAPAARFTSKPEHDLLVWSEPVIWADGFFRAVYGDDLPAGEGGGVSGTRDCWDGVFAGEAPGAPTLHRTRKVGGEQSVVGVQ